MYIYIFIYIYIYMQIATVFFGKHALIVFKKHRKIRLRIPQILT